LHSYETFFKQTKKKIKKKKKKKKKKKRKKKKKKKKRFYQIIFDLFDYKILFLNYKYRNKNKYPIDSHLIKYHFNYYDFFISYLYNYCFIIQIVIIIIIINYYYHYY